MWLLLYFVLIGGFSCFSLLTGDAEGGGGFGFSSLAIIYVVLLVAVLVLELVDFSLS
ncbi:hypothetical protein HDC90_001526 [Pedobacter sp. AK013]|uniref:hypothetical protein n=1 Tax=Pedobacter sp. AK013 TaxID=2723071 RepID=UPI001615723C|nr:hypothetical protein [Pedobacter sp. AK013]MBB6236909.1 hypothetical protein [Pedobacter sp. AK013]